MNLIDLIKKAPHSIAYRIKRKQCYRWMVKQMNLVDPAETKRPKYWKKCGVQTNGNFKVG